MAISRTIWKNDFMANSVPAWTCPSCSKGILEAEEKMITTYKSAFSTKSLMDDEDFEIEWTTGWFGGRLICSNKKCNEVVLIAGDMQVVNEPEWDENGNGIAMSHFIEILTPRYFVPAIHLFVVNEDIPSLIKQAIEDSFKIYWIDSTACANKIRKIVELIMDDQEVVKTYVESKKRKQYTLHKRIEFFKEKKNEEGEFLMAIKSIGNTGSDISEELSKDDVLDAYEILEHVSAKLYDKGSSRIKKLSKAINKNRKPIGPLTSKRKTLTASNSPSHTNTPDKIYCSTQCTISL